MSRYTIYDNKRTVIDAHRATSESIRLTADVVLLTTAESGSISVLLIKRKYEPYQGRWALPGGHVDSGEPTDLAAQRELREETGISVDTLHYIKAYADPGRDPRGRYVTFAYTALVCDPPEPKAADDAIETRWWPVTDLMPDVLAFDHYRILIDTLSEHVYHSPLISLSGR